MLKDQVSSVSRHEQESVFSTEVILLDHEAVIIDNLMGVKFTRLRYEEPDSHKIKSKRLKIISPLGHRVEARRNDAHIQIKPKEIIGDYKISSFYLTAGNSSLQIGDYTISSDMVLLSEGHGVLLKIQSPNPIARAIVPDIPSEEIARGLTIYNNRD
jgi:hypothetical protein